MKHHPNGTIQIQPGDDLPDFRHAKRLYVDFETTSHHPWEKSLNPWVRQYCQLLGISIFADDAPHPYYIPLRHWLSESGEYYPQNYNIEYAARWLREIIATAAAWVNHNVKYDAHCIANDAAFNIDVLEYPIELICTVVRSKVFYSDMQYQGGYGLDNLSAKWLGEDIGPVYDAMKPYLSMRIGGKVNQDYGLVPPDIMAPYAGQDAITCRKLDRFLIERMPEQSKGVCNTEKELTKILVDMERTGLTVDPAQIANEAGGIINQMGDVEERINELTGRVGFRPHVNGDCYDLLCVQYGMPVLAWTNDDDEKVRADNFDERLPKTSGPSFNKHILPHYATHAMATPQIEEVVNLIIAYRALNTKWSVFLKPYLELLGLTGGNVIHGSYNQCVRTGRMSCKQPNMMQLDKAAKALILPPEGCELISTDASQIEFRTIVHYIQAQHCIDAYNSNPDTDFHQWVAELCGVHRKPAKTINFMAGYGGGKKKTLALLMASKEVTDSIRAVAGNDVQLFERMAVERAEKIYQSYHDNLPTLKRTSNEAARRCRNRGYVFNMYGRQRHIPKSHAHIAFNSLNQSCAADIVKDRMVALYRAIQQSGYGPYIKLTAQVHDEVTLIVHSDIARDERLHLDILRILESPTIPLSVPLRWKMGVSSNNWAEASSDDVAKTYPVADIRNTEPFYLSPEATHAS